MGVSVQIRANLKQNPNSYYGAHSKENLDTYDNWREQ
jgi:hypothetical protein